MFLSELTFTGPFTSAVSSYMKLKNPSDKKVLTMITDDTTLNPNLQLKSVEFEPNEEV